MGIFGSILEKLGMRENDAPAATKAPAPRPNAAPGAAPAPAAPAAPAAPKAIAVVDVVADLEKRAAAYPGKLNWRESIVDLLTLLEIDSSMAARKELATELGIPAGLMADSAQMNMWLHKTVLKRIADNGGNVPGNLTD